MSIAPVENYSLLKADHNQQTQHDLNQLKQSVRQREATITDLTRKIEAKRQQMRGLSKQVNTLIQKQAKKTTKTRPAFHPQLPNEQLNKLRDQKETIYKEIEQVKQQIRTLKGDQSDEIVKAIHKQEGVLQNVEVTYSKTEIEKQLIITELQKNRDLIESLKNNSCIQDLQKRQKEYEQVKRQCKQIEKEINQMTAYQLQRNAYFFQMQYIVNREIIPQTLDTVDDQQIKELINYINNAQHQRYQVEKQAEARIAHHQQVIAQLEKSIREKHIQLRELQNDVLRESLESKRFKSHTAPKKPATPHKIEKTLSTQQSFQPKILPKQNPEIHKQSSKKASHKAYLEEGKSLNIGNWEEGQQVLSDRYQSWWSSIQRMKYLTFFYKDIHVYGFKSTYIDKRGLLIEGKEQIIQTDQQFQQLEVPLEDVTQIEYSRYGAPVIKFTINDGRQLCLGVISAEMERISLEGLVLKHIEAAVQGDNIVGLRIAIGDKTFERSPEEMPERTVRTSIQPSFSNADLTLKRKVILKGRSLKKIRQQPIIDHRLLLNKGKFV